jgi:ATP-binding cassette subfamily C protein
MRLLISLSRAYPLQSAIMLMALLLAGVAEGVGLSALLPLISVAMGSQPGAEPGASVSHSGVERVVTEYLSALGLTPTLGVLLVVIVVAIVMKSGLVLLAKKQVGYTVAGVATDLRL